MPDTPDFSEKTVYEDPFIQFDAWYKEHLSEGAPIPETVFLATASEGGRISLRTVLLKDYDKTGFIFYTNYESRKARQLEKNENAALLFYWPEKNRQVRIEGFAGKLSAKISESYFRSRPRDSQLAAWASSQSSEIPGREYLMERFEFYRSKFEGEPVPKPANWGGFRIVPGWFEFWQDRPNRLHDRITYTRENDKWRISRLAP
jgi:pyridoxamine 5'-phosphate oxidase